MKNTIANVKMQLLSCDHTVKLYIRLMNFSIHQMIYLPIHLIKYFDDKFLIVMEYTECYYEFLVTQLSNTNLFVSTINSKLIINFANESLRKVKSDKTDFVKIAKYVLDKQNLLQQYNHMDELRNQLKTMNRRFDFYNETHNNYEKQPYRHSRPNISQCEYLL